MFSQFKNKVNYHFVSWLIWKRMQMVNYCSTYMRKKVHFFINAKTLSDIPKIWKFLRYLIFANPSNKAMD